MNNEVQSIVSNLQNTLDGTPWYGRPVYEMLEEINPKIVYTRPNKHSHSLIDLLYHMNTWAEFTLKRIEGEKEPDMAAFEELDWRPIDPKTHTWKKGLSSFKSTHKKIIQLLKKKDDSFLEGKVDYRKYNFRFLINGMVQHNIYHIGQIAYLKKLLE
jgi:uncharacterized damage-inducible protein DinB